MGLERPAREGEEVFPSLLGQRPRRLSHADAPVTALSAGSETRNSRIVSPSSSS